MKARRVDPISAVTYGRPRSARITQSNTQSIRQLYKSAIAPVPKKPPDEFSREREREHAGILPAGDEIPAPQAGWLLAEPEQPLQTTHLHPKRCALEVASQNIK